MCLQSANILPGCEGDMKSLLKEGDSLDGTGAGRLDPAVPGFGGGGIIMLASLLGGATCCRAERLGAGVPDGGTLLLLGAPREGRGRPV